jgi:predicted DNA-binding ribbon-helix-helix protein
MPRPRKTGYVVTGDGENILPTYNISVGARRTTVKLAPETCVAIERISKIEKCEPKGLFEFIARTKEDGTALSTAIRVFTMQYFMDAATPEGHLKAGHGSLFNQSQMSASELVTIGQLLYGENWKTELARHLGVSRVTVTRWANGEHGVPEKHHADIHQLAWAKHKEMERLFVPASNS